MKRKPFIRAYYFKKMVGIKPVEKGTFEPIKILSLDRRSISKTSQTKILKINIKWVNKSRKYSKANCRNILVILMPNEHLSLQYKFE